MQIKAAIYCRLSKEDEQKKENEESESIQNQRLMLCQYAKEKGWEVWKEYVDEDYSGLDAQRPSFCNMLKDAHKGCFQIILCKSQSRFTRDMELVERYLHTLFPLWGIRFVSIVDAVDTGIKGNKKARQISGLVNEWYCEDLSENIRSVFQEKMKQGQYLAPFAPYGYQKNPENSYVLIPDPEAARVVQRIFSNYVNGQGVGQIKEKLDAEGILPPGIYKKRQGLSFSHPKLQMNESDYFLWSSNTIRQILKNRVYVGDLIQAKQKKVSYKSKKVIQNPKENWIVVSNCHEGIIEQETFQLAQERMSQRRYSNRKNLQKTPMKLLKGMVRCQGCGHLLYRTKGRNGMVYLYCPLSVESKRALCKPHTIKENDLEKIILENIAIRGEMLCHGINDEISTKKWEKGKMCCKWMDTTDLSNFQNIEYEIVRQFIDFIEIGEKEELRKKIVIHWRI